MQAERKPLERHGEHWHADIYVSATQTMHGMMANTLRVTLLRHTWIKNHGARQATLAADSALKLGTAKREAS